MHLSIWLLAMSSTVLGLWPQPKHYEHGSSFLWLSPSVELVYKRPIERQSLNWLWTNVKLLIPSLNDNDHSQNPGLSSDHLIHSAFERMKQNVLQRSYVPQKFHPRNAQYEPSQSDSRKLIDKVLVKSSPRSDLIDEGYTLQVHIDGTVLIECGSESGALHAFETFTQLFFASSMRSGASYTPFAPLSIKDGPAFGHRGLNLDISRNYISPKDVMRTIEAMAANKLNRLHIHASDAQSWPLEIPSFPDLAIKGAYSPSQMWHVEDLKIVQEHGTSHGVEVFVEIDLPGHTTSIGNAFPHLVTAKGEVWHKYAVEPPSGQLRLNSSEVPPFLEALLHDLLSRTSHYSKLFHLGGDELNLYAYSIDPTVESSSRHILQPLLQIFIDQVISLASSHGLTVIMWEEMILDWDLKLPKDIIVQTWRGNQDDALAKILDKGHNTLFGSNDYWYLDCGYGGFLDPEPSNPESPIKPPYLDYCQPYKNWRHMYAYDPLAGVPSHQRHLVLGGEAHLWGELTDSVSLDGMLWPRVAAAAEVMWSGPGKKADEVVTRRLADMRERLLVKGVGAGVVQMEWCLRHEGGCRL